MTDPRPTDTELLAELAGMVLVDEPLEAVLTRVAHVARAAIPGADEVSLTLIRDEKAFTVAYTGQLALDADELQYENGYGPCMDAGRFGQMLFIDDMAVETRWPRYTSRVIERGVGSSISAPLPVQDAFIGALNIYAYEPRSFDPEARERASLVASYAAIPTLNAHAYADARALADHLRTAMESRAVIEQAKGIVMGERRCTADEAFRLLIRVSQESNRKVRDVATALVEQAATPRTPGEPSL